MQLVSLATSIVVAFGVTVLAIRFLTPLACHWGLLDCPHGRKDHLDPTPVTGGPAMLIAVLLTGLLLLGVPGRGAVGMALAATLLIGVGIWDDKCDLRWYVRILAQVGAALLVIYVGDIRVEWLGTMFGVAIPALGGWSVPFTVFAIVGAINAVNMVDGADGLAGLLVLATLVMVETVAVHVGDPGLARCTPILIGAVAGFLFYNARLPWRRRAKVFMGNSGSAMLGLLVACAACQLTQAPGRSVEPVLAIWLVPIPIIDCLVLMLRRIRQGRSPFYADRNHIHHLMLEAGFGPTATALLLVAFSMACGLGVVLALDVGVPPALLFALFVSLGLAWYALSARRERAVAMFRAVRFVGGTRRLREEMVLRQEVGLARELDTGEPSGD